MTKIENDQFNEILDATRGMSRARPGRHLFEKIESKIFDEETKILDLYKWYAAAALILLLILNVLAAREYSSQSSMDQIEFRTDDNSTSPLLSNYNIYDL